MAANIWSVVYFQTVCLVLVNGYAGSSQFENVTLVQKFESAQRSRAAEYAVRREPRFLSFQTKNDKIDVGVEFKVPFLSIPVKRSLDTMMNGGQQAFANVNFGSLLLALVFTAAGATLGGFLRATDDSSGHSHGLFFGPSKKGKAQDTFWDIFETVEKALLKYDIDATACTQRAICSYVKNSKLNVADGKATKSEIVVNGLANADWAMQMLSGNAIEDAIVVGKQAKSCEHVYTNCKLSPLFIESIVKKIQQDSKAEARH